MSEHEKSIVEQYCERMDQKHSRLLNVIYALIAVILGAGAIQFVSFGELKSQVATTTAKVTTMERDYVPTWYMTGMTKLYTLNTEKIVASVSKKDDSEVKKINEEFLNTVEIMQDNFIRLRGGMTQTTRSVQNITGGSK